MSEMKEETLVVSADMHVPFAAEDIWPLLCPVREYDWIEAWKCDVVHSASGVNELGCVFRTDFPTEVGQETWVTSRYEPASRLEFVRMNEARAIRFEITLISGGTGTKLTWTQHVTPLNRAGEEYVKGKPEAFAAQMAALKTLLVHYLETGKMLKSENIGLMERVETNVHGGTAG